MPRYPDGLPIGNRARWSLWFPLTPSPVDGGLLAYSGLHHYLETLQLIRIKITFQGDMERVYLCGEWQIDHYSPKYWVFRSLFPLSSLLLSFCQKNCDTVGPWSFPTALRNISLSTWELPWTFSFLPEKQTLIYDDWQLELHLLLDIFGTCAQGTALARPLEKKHTETIEEGSIVSFLCLGPWEAVFVLFYGAWSSPQRKIVVMILITQWGHVVGRILKMVP